MSKDTLTYSELRAALPPSIAAYLTESRLALSGIERRYQTREVLDFIADRYGAESLVFAEFRETLAARKS